MYLKIKVPNLQTSHENCLCELHFKPGIPIVSPGHPIIFLSRVINDAIKKILWSILVLIIIFDMGSFRVSVFRSFCKKIGLILVLRVDC